MARKSTGVARLLKLIKQLTALMRLFSNKYRIATSNRKKIRVHKKISARVITVFFKLVALSLAQSLFYVLFTRRFILVNLFEKQKYIDVIRELYLNNDFFIVPTKPFSTRRD